MTITIYMLDGLQFAMWATVLLMAFAVIKYIAGFIT